MTSAVYKIYYWVIWVYTRLLYRFHVHNSEKVVEGAAVVCANHSSMMDPIMVALGMRNSNGYNQTKFLAKSELGSVPLLGALINFLIVYVKRGESDIVAVKKSIAHLKAGGKLIVFPEGRRVDVGEKSDAKTGVIMMSMRSGAPLQPVYVSECRKPPFCRRRIDVVFGDAYFPSKSPGESTSEAYHREVAELMRRIEQLGESVQ